MNYQDVIAKFKLEDEELSSAFKKAEGTTSNESICSFNPVIKKYFSKPRFYKPLSI
ncbi:MAG: hypothetical protein M9899_00155 [Bdellovibrionaceae bacterium]|nr:hypothetical protein [Pseudobdellovibrionaceae bacterium]